MFRYLIVGVLVVAGLVVGTQVTGCGPQIKVAGQKAIDKINDLLGKIDVKLAEIEQEQTRLKKAVTKATEARISAKYQLESLNKKKSDQEEQLASLKGKASQYLALLKKAGDKAEVENANGKMVSKAKLEVVLKERLQMIEATKAKLQRTTLPLIKTWEKNMDVQTKVEKARRTQLDSIENKIAQLKAEKERYDTMKQTKTLLGDSESISDSFDDLDKSVDDLLVSLKTQNEIEEGKVDDILAGASEPEINDEDLLGSSADDSSKLISDAEALLGSE